MGPNGARSATLVTTLKKGIINRVHCTVYSVQYSTRFVVPGKLFPSSVLQTQKFRKEIKLCSIVKVSEQS